jgi:hypothetical protein
MRRVGLGACIAICGTLLLSGCAGGTATVSGTLEVGNGHCTWVRTTGANGELYSLRQLPSGYEMDEHGLVKPDGSRIRIGDVLTVSGDLSWAPLEQRECVTANVLDVISVQ